MAKKTTSKKTGPIGRFDAMPDAEKGRIAAQFDQEFIADEAKPLTPAECRRWEKAKRKVGRPKVGKGAKMIALSIEQGLLSRADALAKRRKMTRAALVAGALEAELARARASEGEDMTRQVYAAIQPTPEQQRAVDRAVAAANAPGRKTQKTS